MTLELPESPKAPATRRNATRHSVTKVRFVRSAAVFSNRFKEAMVVTQRSILLLSRST